MPSPPWSASSATSTSPKRRSRRRSSSPRERWPTAGVPPNPGGWITTTARNRAIDRLRREASRHDRHAQAAAAPRTRRARGPVGPVQDDRLRLIFTCCHPALAPSAQVALTLRLLGGLETAEIARAFLVPEADDGAAARAGQAQDPRRQHPVPGPERRRASRPAAARCSPSSTSSSTRATPPPPATTLIRADLCAEAIRLARLLAELMPDEPEVLGLLGAAAADRVAPGRPHRAPTGHSCCCPTRTATRWDRALIAEGQALVARVPAPQPTRAVPDPGRDQRGAQRRADRRRHRLGADPAALRPAARARADPGRRAQPGGRGGRGRRPGRRRSPTVDALDLAGYHLFHATRADLLRRLGRVRRSRRGLRPRASPSSTNAAERRFLDESRRSLPVV